MVIISILLYKITIFQLKKNEKRHERTQITECSTEGMNNNKNKKTTEKKVNTVRCTMWFNRDHAHATLFIIPNVCNYETATIFKCKSYSVTISHKSTGEWDLLMRKTRRKEKQKTKKNKELEQNDTAERFSVLCAIDIGSVTGIKL